MIDTVVRTAIGPARPAELPPILDPGFVGALVRGHEFELDDRGRPGSHVEDPAATAARFAEMLSRAPARYPVGLRSKAAKAAVDALREACRRHPSLGWTWHRKAHPAAHGQPAIPAGTLTLWRRHSRGYRLLWSGTPAEALQANLDRIAARSVR